MGMKGFYFSFDAFLALTVMTTSLFVVSSSSEVATDSFKSNTVGYEKASSAGQDGMKLASTESFSTFNGSFEQELLDQTVMEEEDFDRTILDGVGLLWAARNFTYAEDAVKKYFDSRIPDEYGYRLQVNENGEETVIYETSEIPDNAEYVSSVSRLVSGHRIDRPSEGFQARARATSVTKNETKIVSMPPLGMAPQNSKMEMEKEFEIENVDEIHNGTFYISVHYSGASYFEQFRINDNQYGQSKFDWIHERDTSDGAAAYGTLDITDDLQEGKNSIFIRLKGGNSYNSHFHPGTKIEVDYRSSQNYSLEEELVHERIDMENITSTGGGSSEAGIFSVKQLTVPENVEFVNATYHLRAQGLDSECGYDTWLGRQPGWDVQVNLNEEEIRAECASGQYQADLELNESDLVNGTNVLTTFIESKDDTRWGGDQTKLMSDFSSEDASHIDLWYRRPEGELRFGEIRVTASEQVGGEVEEPKEYVKDFDYPDLESTELYMAQLFSTNPEVTVDRGGIEEEVFKSNSFRSAPTSIHIGSEYYDIDNSNILTMNDVEADPERSYLPESTFQWTVWAPSQVGYGGLFENRTAALEDARERLEEELGPFVSATGIDTGTVSTGDQPYLWGPASVKLVVWRE